MTIPPKKPTPRKPFVKPTQVELQRRVETVARLIGGEQATKTEIHEYCRTTWGVCWMTANRYVFRARAWMIERTQKPRPELIGEAVSFYEKVMRSRDATLKDKLTARSELNDIFGLYAPKQVRTELSGPGLGAIEIEHKAKPAFDFAAYRDLCATLFGYGENGGNGGNGEPKRAVISDAGAVASRK